MPVRASALDARLASIAPREATADEVERLRAFLVAADEWTLDHVNPYELGRRQGLEPERAIAVALAAVRARALEVRFNTLCVFCGAIGRRFARLADGPAGDGSFRCEICDADIAVRAGERIEAAFVPAPGVGAAALDPFESIASYRRRYVSASIAPSPEFAAYLAGALRGQAIVGAGTSRSLSFALAPGTSVRAVSYDRHGTARVRARPGPSRPGQLTLRTTAAGWDETAHAVDPGPLELAVANASTAPTGVLVLDGDTDAYHHAIEAHPPIRRPFLSASELRARGVA